MGSSGHSETEKIKILYEDSLKDIRNLTTRLEEVALKVQSSSVSIDKVADDSAATERHTAFVKAVAFASAGVLFCGLLFGGGGFLVAKSVSSIRVNTAERDLAEANSKLQKENKRVDEYIADLEKKSAENIAQIRAASGWAGTPNGQLAKAFFETGSGRTAATCKASEVWEIVKDENNEKWCIPKRRDLIGGDDKKYGWRIP